MKKALIIGGGKVANFDKLSQYLDLQTDVICVDRGCDYAFSYGLEISLAVGDFDSVNKNIYEQLAKNKVKMLRFKRDKDKTDMQLALDYCCEHSYDSVYVFGALGTRLDHSIANINFLHTYNKSFNKLYIIDDNNIIFLLEGRAILEKKEGYNLSFILAYGNPQITISGVKWPLDKHKIKLGDSLTISNEIVDDYAQVWIENGQCFCFYSKD